VEVLGFVFSIVVVTPIVIVAFVFTYWSRSRHHDRLTEAWRAYAGRRGRAFEPPTGSWPNRTSPAIQWSENGAAFRIEGQGAESIARTCVAARPEVAVLGEVYVTPPDGAAAGREGARPLARLVVWSHPADLADRVLTAEVKRALLGFDPTSLIYRGGEVFLRWPGGEQNDARLDEATAVVRRVLAALAEATSAAGPRDALRSA
jgi:hypothetical protein